MEPLSIWRTELAPGESTYIWGRYARLPVGKAGTALGGKTYSLDDAIPLAQFNWGRTFLWDDPACATGLRIPADVPAGTYHLHVRGEESGIAITVRTSPTPLAEVTVKPSGGPDSAAIQAALDAGKSVRLTVGVYLIDTTIVIPGGAAVRGADRDLTILKRLPKTGDYSNRLFTSVGDYISLSDFTSDGVWANDAILFHNFPGKNNHVTMQRLRLRTMKSIEFDGAGGLVEDVEFENAGGSIGGSHQLWKEIKFKGVDSGANECIARGDQFAMFNATWQDTGRGLILRDGPTNSYFNTLSFNGIQYVDDGNEVILVEDIGGGGGLRNCVFTHIRIRGCLGAVTFWQTPVVNNLFRGMYIEGGGGIVFSPGQTQQKDNVFEDVEMRGCAGIVLSTASGNSFKGLAIISPRPTRMNQEAYSALYYAPRAVIQGASGNVFNPRTIVDLPTGWTEMD